MIQVPLVETLANLLSSTKGVVKEESTEDVTTLNFIIIFIYLFTVCNIRNSYTILKYVLLITLHFVLYYCRHVFKLLITYLKGDLLTINYFVTKKYVIGVLVVIIRIYRCPLHAFTLDMHKG